MTTSEMLQQLRRLRYCVLWPGNWKDIGFTERPIWVNNEGYGYYMDDEPCDFLHITGLTEDFINRIRETLKNGGLVLDDIKGSPLELPSFAWDKTVDEDSLERFLDALSNSPLCGADNLFCGAHYDGWSFFESEEDLIEEFEKYYDYGGKWEEMSEGQLLVWYERLFKMSPTIELPISLSILAE